MYFVGGNLAVSGTITTGTLAAFATYVALIYQPLAQLTNSRVDILTALVSFERVFEVLDFPASIADRPGAIDLVEPEGRIEFDHVWFRHPPGNEISLESLETPGTPGGDDPSDWTLRDVSLVVEPGETVALVGPSGAGKTTIAMLVPRIYEADQGAVRIDGHDVRDLTLDSVHAAIGLVPQDPHLFHDTHPRQPAASPTLTRPTPSSKALERARIWDLVASLPDGLDTVVGERGYRMSGGEKQRLAIARLLLEESGDRDPRRGDLASRLRVGARDPAGLRRGAARPDRDRDRPPTVDDRRRRPHPGRRRRPDRRVRNTHELLARGGLYAELYRTQMGRPQATSDDGPRSPP